MKVIGIDPGSQRTGWGVVVEVSGVLQLVGCGVINAVKKTELYTAGTPSFSGRLACIYNCLCEILTKYAPDCAAIEQVFTAFNAQSALKLGQARGVAVAACAASGLAIYDYEPTLVKKSIVGAGRAEKEQVAYMVKRLLNMRDAHWQADTTDALAVAISHLSQRRFMELAKKGQQKQTFLGKTAI